MDPLSIDTLMHLGVAAIGFGSIGLAQWRGSITIRNRLDNLTKQVERTNGTLTDAVHKQREMELVCAATHGSDRREGG